MGFTGSIVKWHLNFYPITQWSGGTCLTRHGTWIDLYRHHVHALLYRICVSKFTRWILIYCGEPLDHGDHTFSTYLSWELCVYLRLLESGTNERCVNDYVTWKRHTRWVLHPKAEFLCKTIGLHLWTQSDWPVPNHVYAIIWDEHLTHRPLGNVATSVKV